VKASDETKPRQIKDGPWCWQSKATLKTISDIFDATKDIASARSVYVALSEIASDEGSESFTRPISQIASRAAVSYRTAASILNRFESLKLIAIDRHLVEGTKERSPSTFTLLGNDCRTSGNGCSKASLPRNIKETEKKRKETNKKNTHSADFLSLNGLKPEETQIISQYNETLVPLGWLPVDKVTPTVRTILDNCTLERFKELVATAAQDRTNWPRKRSFPQLFWNTRTAFEQLQRLPLHVLKQKRQKCIDAKNHLFRMYGADGKCSPEITAQKTQLVDEREAIEEIIKQRLRQ
jgi:hypothetical protein